MIKSLQDSRDEFGDVKVKEIQKTLKPFNGKYFEHPAEYWVEFKTEQDYLLYLLKWS